MVTINTADDLLRALSENPVWKEAVRREILTEELLKLPARFDRFVATTEAFMAEQREVNAGTAGFIAEQRQTNATTADFIDEQRQVNAEQKEFNATTADFIAEQRQVNAEQKQFNAAQKEFNASTADFIAEQRQVNAAQKEFNASTADFIAEQRQVNAAQKEFNASTADFIAEQRQVNAEQKEFNASTAEFITEQRQVNASTAGFIAEQKEYNVRMERRVDRVLGDIGNMRADYARRNAINEAGDIAQDMGFRLLRTLTSSDLRAMYDAGDNAGISRGALLSFRRADLVIAVADGDGATHYIAVEVSYTADERDTGRALRNAGLLTRFTGCPAHAAIASVRNDDRIRHLIDGGQVHWHQLEDRDSPVE